MAQQLTDSCEEQVANFTDAAQEEVKDASETDAPPQKFKYTTRQKLILIVCALANLGCGATWSLQAPFYPKEAESKGIRPSVYGLVFGAFSLTEFLIAPLYGRFIGVLGVRFLLNAGIFVTSSCCVLFGFLDHSPPGTPFIALSFAIRIVEAMGDAAFRISIFTIVATEFPTRMGTTIAILRTCNGLGLIIGPTVGGALYEIGGFLFPFALMGGQLLFIALIIFIIFANWKDSPPDKKKDGPSMWQVLKKVPIFINFVTGFMASGSIGFLVATLEPHLRKFGLSPLAVGGMFMISSGMYAITTFIWGKLVDNKFHPKLLTTISAVLVCVTYTLLGPAPFIPVQPQLWLCIVGLTFHGLGIAGQVVITNVDALKTAVLSGFPDRTETYGLVGGLMSSFVQLGAFVGPSLGGALLDKYGFRLGSLIPLLAQLIIAIVNFSYYIYERKKNGKEATAKHASIESSEKSLLINSTLHE